jgi:AraC family transcriptional regulator
MLALVDSDRANGAVLPPDLANSLVRLLDCAHRNLDVDRAVAKASLARASSLLQIELERKASGVEERAPRGALAGWQVHRVKAHVDANLDTPIPISDLANVAQRSTAYFCRAFKRTFGETPHAFIIGRRLHRAGELMLTTDAPLAEVAVTCGFSDQAHLCKVFRARHGQSPAAWRRERCDLSRNDAVGDPAGAATAAPAALRRAG